MRARARIHATEDKQKLQKWQQRKEKNDVNWRKHTEDKLHSSCSFGFYSVTHAWMAHKTTTFLFRFFYLSKRPWWTIALAWHIWHDQMCQVSIYLCVWGNREREDNDAEGENEERRGEKKKWWAELEGTGAESEVVFFVVGFCWHSPYRSPFLT